MLIKKLTNLFIFFVCFTGISCINTNKKEIEQTSNGKSLNVCEVTKNISQYDNKVIRIEGSIKGFHELVLYDDNCLGENYLIKVELDEKTQNQLLDSAKKANFSKSNITGKIVILGKVEKDIGRLLYYKGVIVDLKDQTMTNSIKNEVLTVNQISAIQIEKFVPNIE